MLIECKVDQAAALRAGIDAPHSAVKIQVDPAQLTPAQREVIASKLVDGHKLQGLYIAVPSLEGLLESVDGIVADHAERRREANKRLLDKIAAMEERRTEKVKVSVDRDGKYLEHVTSGVAASREAELPVKVLPTWGRSEADPDVFERWQKMHDDYHDLRKQFLDVAVKSLQAEAAAYRAKEADEVKREEERLREAKKEVDRLVDGFPENFKSRLNRGLVPQEELNQAIKRKMYDDLCGEYPHLAALPYEDTGHPRCDWYKADSLTQEQYDRLLPAIETFGGIAEVVFVYIEDWDEDADGDRDLGYAVRESATLGEYRVNVFFTGAKNAG